MPLAAEDRIVRKFREAIVLNGPLLREEANVGQVPTNLARK